MHISGTECFLIGGVFRLFVRERAKRCFRFVVHFVLRFVFALVQGALQGACWGRNGANNVYFFFFCSVFLRASSFNSSSFFALVSLCPNIFISLEDTPLNLATFFNSSTDNKLISSALRSSNKYINSLTLEIN